MAFQIEFSNILRPIAHAAWPIRARREPDGHYYANIG